MNYQHKADHPAYFWRRLIYTLLALVLIMVTSQQPLADGYKHNCPRSPHILSVLIDDENFTIEGENFVENDMTMLKIKFGREDITSICSIVSDTKIDCLLPDVPDTGGDFKLTVSLVEDNRYRRGRGWHCRGRGRGANDDKYMDSWNLTIAAKGSLGPVVCPCFTAFDVLSKFPGEGPGCIQDARFPDRIQLTDGLQNWVVTFSDSYQCNGKNDSQREITEAEMRACVVNLLQIYGECENF